MRTSKLTITRKLLIAEKAIQVNNLKAAARTYKVHISNTQTEADQINIDRALINFSKK